MVSHGSPERLPCWGAMPWVLDPVDAESEGMAGCQERPVSEEFVQREEAGRAETGQ